MKSTGRSKLILKIIVIIMIICGGLTVYAAISKAQRTATLTMRYTPLSAKVFVNGSHQKNSTTRLKPGKYTIEIKKDGFFEYETTIDLIKGDLKSINAILSPNSAKTMNWYNDNIEDMRVIDSITNARLTEQADIINKNFPIAKILPYINARGTFRIDYGKASTPNNQAVYITYISDVAKELALDFIRKSGYNTEDYEIIYREVDYL